MKKMMLRLAGKVFLLAVSTVLAFNLIHLTVLRLCPSLYYADYGYTWIRHLPYPPKILLMGSSTVQYNLHPGVIAQNSPYRMGEIINLGWNARTPLQSYYLFKTMEKDLKSVQKVYYGIDPWVFSRKYYEHDALMPVDWNLRERLFFIKDKEKFDKALLGGVLWPVLSRVAKNCFKMVRDKGEDPGWTPGDLGANSLTQKTKNFNMTAEEWFYHDVFDFSDLQFAYLKKLKEECERKGIQFILLIPPKTKQWRTDYAEKNKAMDDIFVRKLNDYLGESYLTGSFAAIPEELEEQLFSDGIHLTSEGQVYFSRQFAFFLRMADRLPKAHLSNLYSYR